jgi:surfactin synthase thioesterase subunit
MQKTKPLRPRLIGIPYAGGSATSYRALEPFFGPYLDFLTLEAPGHGCRMGEAFGASIEAIALDLANIVQAETKQRPFALFGHSMGAVLAIPLIRVLRARGLALPAALIVSGALPPGRGVFRKISHLPRHGFIESIAALGGMPQEILSEPELMILFEPILRSDFHVVESYRHIPAEKLTVPMTLLLGEADSITLEEAQSWAQETDAGFTVQTFPGGHFFVLNEAEAVANAILQACQVILPAVAA